MSAREQLSKEAAAAAGLAAPRSASPRLPSGIRPYGASGLAVSALGFGAGQLGRAELDEAEAERLLHAVLAAGITLIDTAPSYGSSEERIGRYLSAQRAAIVLSTKLGYGVRGIEDWSAPCITAGIEQALTKLRTDWLDIAHLHSCPRTVLERGEVIEALQRARTAGKIRCAAYSGDGEALEWAIDSGAFDGVQCSFNLVDRAAQPAIRRAAARGLGVILKRPLANAVWRFHERPAAEDLATYWDRWQVLGCGLAQAELALPFVLAEAGASAAIVGTSQVAHLETALARAAAPLPAEARGELEAAYALHGGDWPGQI